MATAEKEYIERGELAEEINSLSITVTGIPCGKGFLTEIMEQYKNSVMRIIDEHATADVVHVVDYAILEQEAGKMTAKLQDMEKRDLVEVVRCEKCKHGQRNNTGPGSGSYMCEYDHGEVLRSPRHFCGYGERLEG